MEVIEECMIYELARLRKKCILYSISLSSGSVGRTVLYTPGNMLSAGIRPSDFPAGKHESPNIIISTVCSTPGFSLKNGSGGCV
jgi:hypothetical protein